MNYLTKFKARLLPASARWLRSAAFMAGLLFCASAGSAAAPVPESRVTIEATQTPIDEVFAAIRKQTGLSVVYSTSEIDPMRTVTLSLRDVPLRTLLDALFRGSDISYTIQERHIVLIRRPVSEAPTPPLGVRGTVKDAAGMPLVGATVVIRGTTSGAAAGVDGGFELPAAKPGDVLLVSLIGYAPQQIAVTPSRTVFDIVMQDSAETIDEVVVTALGIKKQTKALTYNVQEVAGSVATTVKDASFVNTLSGKIAGVQINASASGIGGSTRVVMRGTKSLFGDNNALYVVNGIPMPSLRTDQATGVFEQPDGGDGDGISNLNPEDIESMSVLTGAAAAALYGSQGANGVIVVTTKQGAEGRVRVNYSNSTTFMSPFVMPAFQNRYGSESGSYQSWGAKLVRPSDYEPADFFQTGYNMTHSLSVSGGTERNQIYVSASSVNARGMIPNNAYERYNFTIRNTSELVKEKLTLDVNAQYMRQYDRNQLVQGQYHNPLIPIYLFPRGEHIDKLKTYERYDAVLDRDVQYWPYTDLSMGAENPWWIVNRELFENNRYRFLVGGSLKWTIAKGLTVTGRVHSDFNHTVFTRKIHASSDTKYASDLGNYLNSKRTDTNLYADALLNFNRRYGDFDLTLNVGAALTDAKQSFTSYEGHLVLIPNLFTWGNIDKSDTHTSSVEAGWHDQTQSVFATAQLGWKGMLYLDLTARNDWASQLAFTSSTGFFYPSVGLSAVVSSMADLSAAGISFLKFRGSYSEVGNPPQRFITSENYLINNGVIEMQGYRPATGLKPERTKAFEVGMNAKFLGSRINLDLTYYNTNTYNQLFRVEASPSSTYEYFYTNAGKVNNWGIEATLGYKDDFGPLHWESTLTYSMNRNKIMELVPEGTLDPTTGEPVARQNYIMSNIGSYRMELREGGTMGDIYVTGLRVDHNGDIYADPNTGSVSVDNKTWYYAGSVDPKYRLSWNNNFHWKGLDFGFLIDARVGGVVVSSTQAIMDYYGVSKASADLRDRGGIEIKGGRIDAKSWYGVSGSGTTGVLANYVYSATNVRLREASIGYTLPAKWFRNKLTATVSVVGRNLWMMHCEAPFDPELTASTGTYYQGLDYFMQPSMRTVGFSVRLSF